MPVPQFFAGEGGAAGSAEGFECEISGPGAGLDHAAREEERLLTGVEGFPFGVAEALRALNHWVVPDISNPEWMREGYPQRFVVGA